jgi:hypothetical protein
MQKTLKLTAVISNPLLFVVEDIKLIITSMIY